MPALVSEISREPAKPEEAQSRAGHQQQADGHQRGACGYDKLPELVGRGTGHSFYTSSWAAV
ncbi:MAG TPA: hypothetical protein VL523_07250 [Terriglobia bacterium]|nr:hypothetical protein [Terriglobia bacterium]